MNRVKKAPRPFALATALTLALMPVAGYAAATDGTSGATTSDAIRIENVSYEAFDGGTRVLIDASAPLVYTSYSPEPTELVLDLASTDASAAPAKLDVGTSEVARVDVESAAGDVPSARFTIQMAPGVPAPVFESLGNRLVVTFNRNGAVAATPVEAPSKPSAVAAAEATKLDSVTKSEDNGLLTIALNGNGSFGKAQDFVLEHPDRLIVDLEGVTNATAEESLAVSANGLSRVRVAQYQVSPVPVTRVVFDLDTKVAYHLVSDGSTLNVVLGESAPTAEAASAPEMPVAEAEAPVEAPLAELAPVADASNDAPSIAVPPETPTDLGEDVTLFETADAAMPEEKTSGKGEVPLSFETKTIGGDEKPYSGKPLSLDFKDADIKDIFRFISDFSGLNVVLDPTVSGKITIKLTEVPWDQALDIILKNNGLGMVFENNVIRIATTSKLAQEEVNRRRLLEEKELAVPLKTITRALSYAKANDLQKILEKMMSKRGEVIVDKRTNTLILTDVPDKFDTITNLIETLDAPTPQVIIEARIVETTKDLVTQLGIQWGFNGISDAVHGNTTGLIFPNNVLIDGAGVQSSGGLTNNPLNGYAVNLPAAGVNSGIGLSLGNVLDTFRLDIALTALEREGKGRIISAPKVTTQNNSEAEIKSGKQIPVTTIANNTVTTTFVDALLSLKVTPQITAEGTVIMTINVDKSQPDFANTVQGSTTPPIDKRAATTSVLVRDGGTTVIGGIFQVTDENSQERTPFLSKIPILGNLFKNKSISRTNNELLIFVTPRIAKY